MTKALSVAEEQYKKQIALAEEWHNTNKAAIENNTRCRVTIFNFLERFGIKRTERVPNPKSRKRFPGYMDKVCDHVNVIHARVPVDDGYKSYIEYATNAITNIRSTAKGFLETITVTEAAEKKENDKVIAVACAIAYFERNNIPVPEGVGPDELISRAETMRREEWIKDNYPPGTVIQSACDNCEEYTVGEHRCSCGDTRNELSVDGSAGNYIAYATRY